MDVADGAPDVADVEMLQVALGVVVPGVVGGVGGVGGDSETDADRAVEGAGGGTDTGADDGAAITDDRGRDAAVVGPRPVGCGAPTNASEAGGVDGGASGSDPMTSCAWRSGGDPPVAPTSLPITRVE